MLITIYGLPAFASHVFEPLLLRIRADVVTLCTTYGCVHQPNISVVSSLSASDTGRPDIIALIHLLTSPIPKRMQQNRIAQAVGQALLEFGAQRNVRRKCVRVAFPPLYSGHTGSFVAALSPQPPP